ncbi:DNA recombination protein RmuC [Sulfurospirillum sp. 1612]|uniref:DNA recombination protein RmuC n=1 Tax=Sulfurospirillum sp. 1612 TaxID=3094835 RepID=UPI002F92D146
MSSEMILMSILIVCLLIIVCLIGALFFIKHKHDQVVKSLRRENNEQKIHHSVLESQLQNTQSTLERVENRLAEAQDKIYILNSEKSKAEARWQAQQESHEKLQEDFLSQSQKLELRLNEIMQKNLDLKIKKFDATSLQSMHDILKPFKDNLDDFKHKIEASQEHATIKFAKLSKEIEQVTKAGMHIGKEAENLAQALKGKKQTQGSWGEMILESVLEYSGLHYGTHYITQESYKDESGKMKRPDVIIKLPQDRSIIIDSKVSLNDYDRYIRAESDEARMIASKGVVSAFKNHIDTLDSKDYAHYQVGTLQYVFMFVPIEGAFALAVQENPDLYEYALDKHIAIVNPSTLTVSLRTIYLYWQSEQSNSNALKMFQVAGKLYDKMVNFADNFNRVGDQIQTLEHTYEKAKTQLTEGGGNVMKRVEELKTLGAKTTKSLKSTKLNYDDFDADGVDVIESKKE